MTSPILPVAARLDLAFEYGKGAWLYDQDGKAYLDFASGIAVNALGHCHPHLVRALKKQAGKIWHTSNTVRIPEGERLAQRLVDSTFAEVIYFANSGGEANEAAVKMARRRHAVAGRPERYRIVTFEGAFHGRTLAMIAATGHPPYIEGFGPKVEGFDQVQLDDWDALEAVVTDQTAALMIEPIQGEGGLRVVKTETLERLRRMCDERGMLLILDEVQSGVGRTGRFFAHEWSGIVPDIVTVAKGIGGGFPMGACLATRHAAEGMTLGTHGTTFGGNPPGHGGRQRCAGHRTGRRLPGASVEQGGAVAAPVEAGAARLRQAGRRTARRGLAAGLLRSRRRGARFRGGAAGAGSDRPGGAR